MNAPHQTDNAIPVTILTGFLGAGKTTLLNRILCGDHGLRVAVLVNDFGSINIDAELVVGVEDDMISLANGCVCCQVRDDLVEAIDQLLAQPQPVEYVLLEASGIADPGSLFVTFADAKYQDRIRVDSITCVVDAEQVFDENDPEPVALLKLRQIGFADLLVLNKTDLVDEDQVIHIRKWIDSHLNRVRIVEASHCQIPLDILLGVGRFHPAHQHGNLKTSAGASSSKISAGRGWDSGHALEFDRWSYETKEPMCLATLKEMIKRQLPASVYRCKGIVHTVQCPGKRSVLQVVGRRCNVSEERLWGPDQPLTRIVAIGAAGQIDGQHLTGLFDGCIAGRRSEDTPIREGVRIVTI